MKFLYVAIILMTLSHNYNSSGQTLEGFGLVMRLLLTSGFKDETDCGGDTNLPIEEYFGFLFPNLMCKFLGTYSSISRFSLVFECLKGKRYLLVSYNYMYDVICTEGKDNYESEWEVDFLDEDDYDALGLTLNPYYFIYCEYLFLAMRCAIYKQCDAYSDLYCW